MRKKVLVALLSFALAVSLVCGCGNKNDSDAVGENVPAVEGSADPSAEGAAESSASSAESSVEGSTENSAEDAAGLSEEGTPSEESTSDPGSEVAAEPEESAGSQEGSVEMPAPETTQTPEGSSGEQASGAGDSALAESPEIAALPEQAAYTVTELSATMYAQNAVNLRQGPGTGYAKVGSLTKGQQVNVTGQAGNGWYQLDNGAFVSNKYLTDSYVDDAVAGQQTAGTTSDAPAAAVDLAGGIGATVSTAYVANATDFFNYMNQQRSANGLSMLTWDDGMAAVAQRRAKELATDYSHNGNVERYGENIHNNTSGSYVDWYNSFYDSSAHRETMMTPNYGRGAAAVYFDGYKYYVVCNFAGTPITTEQLIEQSQPENLVPAGGNEEGTTFSFSTTGETIGPDDPDYGFIYDLFEQERERLN